MLKQQYYFVQATLSPKSLANQTQHPQHDSFFQQSDHKSQKIFLYNSLNNYILEIIFLHHPPTLPSHYICM